MSSQESTIRDIKPSQKNINLVFIVLDIGKPNRTKDGHDVRTVKVADKTGSINVSMWDELGEALQSGDICRLVKGYSSIWKGCLTLYTGKGGEIHRIGEFCMQFVETPNMSEPNPEYMTKAENSQRKSPNEQESSNQPISGQNQGQSSGANQSGQRQPSSHQGNGVGPRRPPVGSTAVSSHARAGQVNTNGHGSNNVALSNRMPQTKPPVKR